MPVRRNWAWWEAVVAVGAVLAAVAAVWVTLDADFLAYPGWLAAQKADFILGPVFVGLYWRRVRPGSRFGPLLIVFGAVGAVYILQSSSNPWLFGAGVFWEAAIFLGTLVQSAVLVGASLLGGRLSDWTGRRKIFVVVASVVYGVSMFVIAAASSFNGFLVGMAIGGLGFGMYMAVDLALVVDVLPDPDSAAKDLGVLNIAGALPSSIAPAVAPLILAVGGGSYGVLYAVAGVCALAAAATIVPVKQVR